MSVARHHAEWMSLVESSGPFLSMPVLLRIFPQGLDPRDSAKAGKLREAYEDWLDRGAKRPDVHFAWIRHVLTDVLEYPAAFLVEGQAIPPGMEAVVPNVGETLRPTFVLKHRDADKKPLLLIEHYSPGQDLEKPVSGKLWKATPGTRMMELLHAADVPLGLITNGEEWMLVYAPRGETTGFASWYADIWMQEPITLRAFHSLLHLRRFLGVAEPETLAAMYAESSKDQQEVTDQLGYQVRQAVEMLVQAFDRIDAESGRTLLAGVAEKALYDSALTVMMRLVFLFSADERGLLLLGDPLYDQHYAVSTLSELLRERADQQGEEVLERRHDAWCRLLATFRAVHGGVQHESMRLPAYGGTLFDPDRYPFLEGRAADTHWHTTPAKPLPINNRVVLHLLEALQVLRVKVPGGGPAEARRISFRALDIEQIGHVYEGLLDHTAKRAGETVLGLAGSKNSDTEIPLSKLEELAAKGNAALIEFLKEETGRSDKALKRLIEEPPMLDEHALLIACGQDPRLAKRVKPFAALVRPDSFDRLVIIPEGSVYVTAGSDRRSTGTHYTPRSLTEPIVQHTLEPLVYTGPAEGTPKAEWKLKPARELLALKVCDMTMGSGAFLVQTCRYLSERLVESWESAEKAHPGCFVITPEGELSTGSPGERLLPKDPAERIAIARRYVADRCLYGVDINPMAVEMAKLSLWLTTLQKDRPFTFLDHAFKCGDSLLGVSSVKQIENFSLRPGERQFTFATSNLFRYVNEASAKRRALEDLPSNDHTQIDTKNRLHAQAETAIAKVKAMADVLIVFELLGLNGNAYEEQREQAAGKVQLLMKRDADASLDSQTQGTNHLSAYAGEQLRGRRPFHWPVEFPEVFARDGFDAFVGNPPFLFGELRPKVVTESFALARGQWDACWLMLEHAFSLGRASGAVGIVMPDPLLSREDSTLVRNFVLKRSRRISIRHHRAAFAAGVRTLGLVVWRGKDLQDGLEYRDDEQGLPATASYNLIETCLHHRWIPPWHASLDLDDGTALRLGDVVSISRGEEIGKSALQKRAAGRNEESILTGSDVEVLFSQPQPDQVVSSSLVVKNRALYAAPKVVVVKTGKAIRGAIDRLGLPTLQSVYNLHLTPMGRQAGLTEEFLCALLVSEVVNSRFILPVTSGKKLFPQITQSMIAGIHFPAPDQRTITEVTHLVRSNLEDAEKAAQLNMVIAAYFVDPKRHRHDVIRRAAVQRPLTRSKRTRRPDATGTGDMFEGGA
jgi:hypothetical protein